MRSYLISEGSATWLTFGTSGSRRITPEEFEQEKQEIEERSKSPPELTESNPEFTEHQRRVRDSVFSTVVKEAYNETCAVCDEWRISPAGNPEVEAAHIYPKSKDGTDDPRNGIALCKLHHWAFDVGWIAITPEGTVEVRDAPHVEGYEEFKQLEGTELSLPDDPTKRPDPMYIEARRAMEE